MRQAEAVQYGMGPTCTGFIINGISREVSRAIYPLHIVTEPANEPGKERITVISGCSFY